MIGAYSGIYKHDSDNKQGRENSRLLIHQRNCEGKQGDYNKRDYGFAFKLTEKSFKIGRLFNACNNISAVHLKAHIRNAVGKSLFIVNL